MAIALSMLRCLRSERFRAASIKPPGFPFLRSRREVGVVDDVGAQGQGQREAPDDDALVGRETPAEGPAQDIQRPVDDVLPVRVPGVLQAAHGLDVPVAVLVAGPQLVARQQRVDLQPMAGGSGRSSRGRSRPSWPPQDGDEPG